MQDGNLFAEIGFCNTRTWPEPDRWEESIVNYVMMMAWERNAEGRTRLYPSARFQIMRDLYFVEWQERSQRLGELRSALACCSSSLAASSRPPSAAHHHGCTDLTPPHTHLDPGEYLYTLYFARDGDASDANSAADADGAASDAGSCGADGADSDSSSSAADYAVAGLKLSEYERKR